MGSESPFTAYKGGTATNKTFIEGTALGVSTDQINQFLAAHPITAHNPTPRLQDATGELHRLDEADPSDRVGLLFMAADCARLLDSDGDYEHKKQACRAKLNTIVRLQNPDLALEEMLVNVKADEIDHDFIADEWLRRRDDGISPDEIDALPKPGDKLRRDFKAYVNTTYDIGYLRGRARDTFTPYLSDDHALWFEMMTTEERIADPARVTAFGSFATARVVTVKA